MTPQEIADIFAEIELKLIAGLKEALKVGKTVDYSSFKLQTLRSMEAYRKHCSDIWVEYLPMIEEEMAELLETAYVDGVRDVQLQHEQLFPDEDMEGELHQRFAGVNTRRMDSLIEDANHNLHTAQTASLRMMNDVYREVVYKAEIHHATGAVTMPQAVDQAVKDFLERGINCIEYSNGRRVNIATYAEMALRTASLRSKLRGEAAKRREFGVDTVLVSQYGACSDTCLPWQGRVYIDDVWGDNTNIWVVDGRGQSLNGQWYPLLSEAVEGGLFHPNCRHGVTTWYEGVSRMPTPLDATAVRERSRLEQRQRELERKVRKWKRLEEGSQTPEAIAKYKRRRLDAQKTLREFIREHDDVLRRDYWREKTYSIGKQEPATDVGEKEFTSGLSDEGLKFMREQTLSLPEESKAVLRQYSGFTATQVNTALATGRQREKYQPTIDQLDRALEGGIIPESITVIRKTTLSHLGISHLKGCTEAELAEIVGDCLVLDTFCSTSLVSFPWSLRNVELHIRIPAGFKGAQYLRPIAYEKYQYQEEVLLRRGLTLSILSAKIIDNKYVFNVEVIV